MLMLEVGDINAHFYYKSVLSDILCYKTLYLLMISPAKLQLILLLLLLCFHPFAFLCYQTQNHHFNYLINLCYVNYECLTFYPIPKQLHKVPNLKMWELVKSQLVSMMEVQDINVKNLLLMLKFLSFSTTFPMQLQQKETVEKSLDADNSGIPSECSHSISDAMSIQREDGAFREVALLDNFSLSSSKNYGVVFPPSIISSSGYYFLKN